MKQKVTVVCIFVIICLSLKSIFHHVEPIPSILQSAPVLKKQISSPPVDILPGFIRFNHRVCGNETSGRELPLHHCYGLHARPRTNSTRYPPPADTSVPSPFARQKHNTTELHEYWKTGDIVHFQPPMTESQNAKSIELLGDVLTLMRFLNSTWWAGGGTLIGSLRHSNAIPWDDDLDLEILITDFLPILGILDAPSWDVPESEKADPARALELENTIKWEYSEFGHKAMGREWWLRHKNDFNDEEMRQIKYYQQKYAVFGDKVTGSCGKIFFRENRLSTTGYPWLFPFVDFFCWTVDLDHRRLESLYSNLTLSFAEVFPLHFRPFGNLIINVANKPSQTLALLDWGPVFSECITSQWDHINELGQRTGYGTCADFYSVYPFIRLRHTVRVHLSEVPLWLLERLKAPKKLSVIAVRKYYDHFVEIVKVVFNTTIPSKYKSPLRLWAASLPTSKPPQKDSDDVKLEPTEKVLPSNRSEDRSEEIILKSRRRRLQSNPYVDSIDPSSNSPHSNFFDSHSSNSPDRTTTRGLSGSKEDVELAGLHTSLQSFRSGRENRLWRNLPAATAAGGYLFKGWFSNEEAALKGSLGQPEKRLNSNQMKDLRLLFESIPGREHVHALLLSNPAVVDVTVEEMWIGERLLQTNFIFGGDYWGLELSLK